jgi:hypothetical protein
MNQVLGVFGLLEFTMLQPGLAWLMYFFNFQFFFFWGGAAVNCGY